ncbi:MAG: RNA methyltransferase [Elusimicrobiaceae bacterium]|nr:RNA methyltransferase [Elusimicrobiaceae bacterium]
MKSFCVVLVRPRDPNNIGAAARAMANFGLSDLRVVDPFAVAWREAVSAVGAEDIMQNAVQYKTLDEALADTVFSLAATALRNRHLEQEIVTLPVLNTRLQTAPEGKIALVFGNEKTGLSGEDIERCVAVLNIPTVSKQPSINLAQAVILTCYELSRRADFVPLRTAGSCLAAPPTDCQKEILVEKLYTLCEKADLRPDLTADQRKAFLRRLVGNLSLNEVQLFFAKSLAERISQRIK